MSGKSKRMWIGPTTLPSVDIKDFIGNCKITARPGGFEQLPYGTNFVPWKQTCRCAYCRTIFTVGEKNCENCGAPL